MGERACRKGMYLPVQLCELVACPPNLFRLGKLFCKDFYESMDPPREGRALCYERVISAAGVAVVVAAAAATAVVSSCVTAVTAYAEQENEDDDPAAVVTTKVEA